MRRLFYINAEINALDIFKLEKKIHYIGKAAQTVHSAVIAENVKGRNAKYIGNVTDDGDRDLDLALFVLLDCSERFADLLRKLGLAQSFFFSELPYSLSYYNSVCFINILSHHTYYITNKYEFQVHNKNFYKIFSKHLTSRI